MSDSNHFMKGGNLVQVLADSLNPSKTNASYQTLSNLRSNNGFAIDLLVISDDANYNADIRLSALIYLKNIIQDHIDSPFIPEEDISTIKASLLQALIRNVTNPKLTPTFREIIFTMAQKYYPREWPDIVKDSVAIVEKSTDLGGLLGAVEALKAVHSVFGGSVSKQIQLNNLCNKTLIPLLNLASKLFQNFNQQTSYVLVCLFKLLLSSMTFYLPEMIQMNIHSVMIFIKKILDLTIDLSSSDNNNLYMLKRISLKIVFKMYQKHANFKITDNKQFAEGFQQKYTKPLLQSLIVQIMLPLSSDRNARHRALELIKISFASIAYINRENKEAALALLQNKESLLKLCMEKFKTSLTRNYSSFSEFKLFIQENRAQMKEFVFSMLNCEAIPQQQTETANAILGLLLQYLQKGDDEQKQLSLYLFTEIAGELKYLTDKLDEKMIMLIMNYVQPLLKEGNHIMIRARACQLISNYNYLDFPESQMTEMATLIYSCLLAGKGDQQTFLKVYACHAFNSIMKYDPIAEFIKPYIPDILAIYTDLLQADTSIIKNFEDLINLLEEEIAPFANDLVQMFINMFQSYSQNVQPVNRGYKEKEDDDEDSLEEEETNNQLNAKACISSIRQVLQSTATVLNSQNQQRLFNIIVWVFSDLNQNYIQQGYNVLNLLLYKLTDQAESKYFIFFKVIVYAILGLPQEYVDNLQKKGDEFSVKYATILNNICLEPDNDIIENSIGCLRNFIAKSTGDFLRTERDDFNNSCMDYLFKVVKVVHESQNRQSSQTERLIVLTIYISLIEYRRVDERQLADILSSVSSWMEMEQEAAEAEYLKNRNSPFGQHRNGPKYIYSSVYLQIILLAINFYEKAALQQININSIAGKVVQLADSFKCDYELSRIILGLSYILDNQLLGDEGLVRSILEVIPELVRRLCKSRQEGDDDQNDLDMDDEAEEERDDENTHMMGWRERGGNATNKDLMLKGEEEEEDLDWEEEFNKFYVSPLDENDQLTFLADVMKRLGHIYGPYMSQAKQEQLSLYLTNAPPKNNSN